MIKDEDIKIGNKFIGLVNNEIFEIIDIYLGLGYVIYIRLEDSKGNRHEISMNTFIHLQLKRIKEVKEDV